MVCAYEYPRPVEIVEVEIVLVVDDQAGLGTYPQGHRVDPVVPLEVPVAEEVEADQG